MARHVLALAGSLSLRELDWLLYSHDSIATIVLNLAAIVSETPEEIQVQEPDK
ncbi:plasmid SOS inhibition protein A [Escherichia coli]|nr:plasmid SOS inhibition protein A [Escherichia coli]